ncbi:Uncharacterised protein [Bacteroides xylanisolvens]|nr:Uncharacterised protein [Bacteroides xylanisolvens]
MNSHFFTAPFCFAFIWFRVQVAASPPFLEDGILVSQPFPLGNAIKLSGRTFLAPHRGSSPKGRGGYAAVLPESVGISIVSDYSTSYAIPLACPFCLRHFPRRGKQVATTLILTAFVCRLKVLFIDIRNTSP